MIEKQMFIVPIIYKVLYNSKKGKTMQWSVSINLHCINILVRILSQLVYGLDQMYQK